MVPKLPKPLLQQLTAEDDVEHFLAVFERVANQQKCPEEEVWAMTMAAYAVLPTEEANDYR